MPIQNPKHTLSEPIQLLKLIVSQIRVIGILSRTLKDLGNKLFLRKLMCSGNIFDLFHSLSLVLRKAIVRRAEHFDK